MDSSSLLFAKLTAGLAGGIVVLVIRLTGTFHSILPWGIIGLGFVAALDALGAAIDRGSKKEGIIRFLVINAIFLITGVLLLLKW